MIDVTENEIRRSGAELIAKSANPELAAEIVQAIVKLWKRGAINPMRRNAAGKIVWSANPDFDRHLLKSRLVGEGI